MKTVQPPPIVRPPRHPVWPFVAALGLLLVSSAGLAFTLTRPEGQPQTWYTNPWFWLASMTLLTVALTVALFMTRRKLRQRMQTALVVSMILHVLLAIYLKDQVLALILDDQNHPDHSQVAPLPTMPEYYLPATSETRSPQAFEQPTDASFDGQLAQMSRRQTQSLEAAPTDSQLKLPTANVPEENPLQRQSMSAARQAPSLSRRSRNDSELATRAESTIRSPASRRRPTQRRRNRSRSTATPAQSQAARQKASSVASLSRPSSDSPTEASSLSAEFSRARSRPTQSQRSDSMDTPTAVARVRSEAARLADSSASTIPSLAKKLRSGRNAAASLEFTRSNTEVAPSTSQLSRRTASRSTSTVPSLAPSAIPKAAAAPRVSGRRQASSRQVKELAMNSPTRSQSRGRVRETAAADIEPSPPMRARVASSAGEPSPATLARNSVRGRPATRSRRTETAAADDSAMTRGTTGTSSLPRAERSTTAASERGTSSRRPERQLGAATANELAARQVEGLPESRSEASPSVQTERPNIGTQNQLARIATAGPAGRSARGTRGSRSAQDQENKPSDASAEATAKANTDGALASQGSRSARRRPNHSRSDTGGGATDNEAGNGSPQVVAPSRGRRAAELVSAEALASAPGNMLDSPSNAAIGSSSEGSDSASEDENSLTAASGALARRRSSLPTRVAAETGAGGMGSRESTDAGIQDRRARPRARVARSAPSRFLGRTASRPRSSQLAQLDGQARKAATPFAGRVARRAETEGNKSTSRGAPSQQTEEMIERGLEYLVKVQHENGRWSFQGGRASTEDSPLIISDTAATGLALLSFLGAGYDHFDGDHRQVVADGIAWLVDGQQAGGDLYQKQTGPANQGIWLYSHGIAAIALCEAYGMTGDEKLKDPAQKALDFIVASQHRTYGGWRYSPGATPDLSVSGWQLMAMRSGQLAGLEVSADAFAGVRRLLQNTSAGNSQFVYSPWSRDPNQAQIDRSPTAVMTSVGLLMRLYTGSGRRDAEIQEGSKLLSARLPIATRSNRQRSMQNPNRDAYYWYNATQVMFHMQGQQWEAWREALYSLLADSQQTSGKLAGSWDPFAPQPDRWARHAGRLYVTTMNLLSLEVYYRHLPLYDSGLASQ